MASIAPSSAEDLAHVLKESAAAGRTISLSGNNSKQSMAGPISRSEVNVSAAGLDRVLRYEPNDLTLSVEAGAPWASVQRRLSESGQMIALDPPFHASATVGGVVAANASGPMRRGYGTVRDLVIGMEFATLEGSLVSTGGMVVKNVAGLDLSKLLIGSFGTLAAITRVNFRLHPLPLHTRTFLYQFDELHSALKRCAGIRNSRLQPMAVDLLSPAAATRCKRLGYLLALRVGGSARLLERYRNDLRAHEELEEDAEFWSSIREFTPDFLARQPGGIVLRIASLLSQIGEVFRLASGAAISRAANGVTYVYLSSAQSLPMFWEAALNHRWRVAVEFAPGEVRQRADLWLVHDSEPEANAFAMMKKMKQSFDPRTLLNRARLYGRI